MTLKCDECGEEVSGERVACTAFASRYKYECECGNSWTRSKWSQAK